VVAIKNAQLYERTEELTMGSIRTITGLLERQFGKDRSHLELVAEISVEVGRQMGLIGTDIVNLERGILLLDAGQLLYPELSLEKKERLSKKEFQALRTLPIKAANLLKSISSLKPALPIILHRHERYDGRGYPEGLKGDEIPIGARIVSVVDSFAAMLSKRHYRRPKTVAEALHEIEMHKGSQFDPLVVATFLKVVKNDAILNKIQNLALRMGSEIRFPVAMQGKG
jgi:HD-GYP domain-containing protein (c-di-GMP phosphodiesterase class II)